MALRSWINEMATINYEDFRVFLATRSYRSIWSFKIMNRGYEARSVLGFIPSIPVLNEAHSASDLASTRRRQFFISGNFTCSLLQDASLIFIKDLA